jgi:hypothetical protein
VTDSASTAPVTAETIGRIEVSWGTGAGGTGPVGDSGSLADSGDFPSRWTGTSDLLFWFDFPENRTGTPSSS